jgi:hypothetical protein
VFGRLMQDDLEFEVSLSYTVISGLKKTNKKTTHKTAKNKTQTKELKRA